MKEHEKTIYGCTIKRYSVKTDFGSAKEVSNFIKKLQGMVKLNSLCLISDDGNGKDDIVDNIRMSNIQNLENTMADIISKKIDTVMIDGRYKGKLLATGIHFKDKNICLYVTDNNGENCDEVARFLEIE